VSFRSCLSVERKSRPSEHLAGTLYKAVHSAA
jgi:hypothetical protein